MGDEWVVGKEKKDALLKAPVGVDPTKPPQAGWKFRIKEKYEEDASLTCTSQLESPCCSITVSLSGEAKKEKSYCEGEYKSTGMTSMGRQVICVNC